MVQVGGRKVKFATGEEQVMTADRRAHLLLPLRESNLLAVPLESVQVVTAGVTHSRLRKARS